MKTWKLVSDEKEIIVNLDNVTYIEVGSKDLNGSVKIVIGYVGGFLKFTTKPEKTDAVIAELNEAMK